MDLRAALTALGLGGAVALFARMLRGVPNTLGARALERARSQVGVSETTGNNDGAQIARYFAGATRIVNGQERATGWTPGWEWCAAFASWCGYDAREGSEPMPHGWRIAVWELVRDARAVGTWRDWAAGKPGGPRPGDLVIFKRGSGDPRNLGSMGHVARCVSWDGVELVTIGGNEHNAVTQQGNAARMAEIVGLISYS